MMFRVDQGKGNKDRYTILPPRLLLKFLFDAAAGTLLAFGRNNLGGKAGFIALLHTWDQKLLQHVHLHCLVPAGVLSENGGRWIGAPKKFLFPVRALAAVFRGGYTGFLLQAFAGRKLVFPGQADPFRTRAGFDEILARLRQKPWIVFAKPPFGGPEKVLDYLGRNTHRVAWNAPAPSDSPCRTRRRPLNRRSRCPVLPAVLARSALTTP